MNEEKRESTVHLGGIFRNLLLPTVLFLVSSGYLLLFFSGASTPLDREVPMRKPGKGPHGDLLKSEQQTVQRYVSQKWFPYLFGYGDRLVAEYVELEETHEQIESILKSAERYKTKDRDITWREQSKVIAPLYEKMETRTHWMNDLSDLHAKKMNRGKASVNSAAALILLGTVIALLGPKVRLGGIIVALAGFAPIVYGCIDGPFQPATLLFSLPFLLPAWILIDPSNKIPTQTGLDPKTESRLKWTFLNIVAVGLLGAMYWMFIGETHESRPATNDPTHEKP